MAGESSVRLASDSTPAHRRVLEDARHRLVALADDLRPDTASEAALLATAAALDRVVHRIRWVADLSHPEEGS